MLLRCVDKSDLQFQSTPEAGTTRGARGAPMWQAPCRKLVDDRPSAKWTLIILDPPVNCDTVNGHFGSITLLLLLVLELEEETVESLDSAIAFCNVIPFLSCLFTSSPCEREASSKPRQGPGEGVRQGPGEGVKQGPGEGVQASKCPGEGVMTR